VKGEADGLPRERGKKKDIMHTLEVVGSEGEERAEARGREGGMARRPTPCEEELLRESAAELPKIIRVVDDNPGRGVGAVRATRGEGEGNMD
jgi:hypothetical protein